MDQSRISISNLTLPLFLLVLVFILYWPALRVFFSTDDLQFLLKVAGIDENTLGFRRFMSVRLFFGAAWRFFGNRPWPYHLVVLFLHAANGWIVYLLARRLGLKNTAACAASILFTVAPTAFTPLHWISGIQEVSMTFFALIAAYFYLGRSGLSAAVSLASACLSMLCKESSFLLLPALAVLMPASRKRRLILATGGLVLGILILAAVGSLTPRPRGDAYETVLGLNILWNLLTYSAWLARIWDYFPDRITEYQEGLAGWGLILPLLLGLTFWRYSKSRRPIVHASLLFVLLLLPVLPLVRHSYFYYLYLPLVPFWLLVGSLLGNIPRRSLAAGILVLFILHAALLGMRHRRAINEGGVLADPILRYAALAENAVESIRETNGVTQGHLLVMAPSVQHSVDLAKGLRGSETAGRKTYLLVERALIGGRALKIFFPAIETVTFQTPQGETPAWHDKQLYWTYGPGEIIYLGYGEEGRFNLVQLCMSSGDYNRAEVEVRAILGHRPDNPGLIFMLGQIALKQGNEAKLESALEQLESLANEEARPGMATKALNALKQLAAQPAYRR
jgi:hypothetical protein